MRCDSKGDPIEVYKKPIITAEQTGVAAQYEFPDEDFTRKSSLLQNLLICFNLGDQLKRITGIAFDAVDADGSGNLDQAELYEIVCKCSDMLDVVPPSPDDMEGILMELDSDFDGLISKEEFHNMIVLVIGKMLETEEDIQNKINAQIWTQENNQSEED